MPPRLIDVHTHAQFAAYENSREVVDRALADGIWMVNVGTQQDTSRMAVELAEKYKEGVYAAIGLHPIHTDRSFHDKKELGEGEAAKEFVSRGEIFQYSYYKKLAESSKVVAIGECGLDYYHLSQESKAKQIKAFEDQIHLAFEVKKPLMIHCREAFYDLIKILDGHKDKLNNLPGITHFFAGSKNDAKALMEMGFYFSFGGVTTFTHDYDEVIKYIGLDKILLETDAPYVTPTPFRGKRNEPAYVKYVADGVAKILGVLVEEVSKRTTENAKKVFKFT